jgi:RNA polymerase sigma-70 factor (ECF subfamily)
VNERFVQPGGEDEAGLVRRARLGDRDAFEALVRDTFESLFRFCVSLAGHDRAMDLAQEAVLKALRAISRFRGEARFRSWLLTIARNTHLNEIGRMRHRRERAMTDGLDERPAQTRSPEEIVSLREIHSRIEHAVAALPEAQRTALVLCDREGYSYKEIAEVMGTPIGTVMSRIHYARNKLRKTLGGVHGL